MENVTALGLMSGTSMDGIDLAQVATDGEGSVVRGAGGFVPYDAAFRRRLTQALTWPKSSARSRCATPLRCGISCPDSRTDRT